MAQPGRKHATYAQMKLIEAAIIKHTYVDPSHPDNGSNRIWHKGKSMHTVAAEIGQNLTNNHVRNVIEQLALKITFSPGEGRSSDAKTTARLQSIEDRIAALEEWRANLES